MYPRILVPVDGSEASRCGLAEAIRLAAPERSTLVLLHVVDLPPASPHGTDGVGREQLMALLARRARETLDSAVDQARAGGVPHETVLVESTGAPACEAIVDHAVLQGCALIAMGSHGRRGMRRLAMGSDAEQVVRRATVPVLVAKPQPQPV